jgi:hypothetical protein
VIQLIALMARCVQEPTAGVAFSDSTLTFAVAAGRKVKVGA